MTPSGLLEFHPGETYYIISSNCEIKIEIRIDPRIVSPVIRPELVLPTPTSTTTPTTTSTTTSTITSTTSSTPTSTTNLKIFSDSSSILITESLFKSAESNEETAEPEVSNAVEARIQNEDNSVAEITIFFIGFISALFLVGLGFCVRKCIRKRGRHERERTRGHSPATDCSYQSSTELYV